MKLKIKFLNLETGGNPVVTLSRDDAEDLGVKASNRVWIEYGKNRLTAIVNIVTKSIPRGIIGVYDEVREKLKLKENDYIELDIAKYPNSLQYIRNKLQGRKLTYDEIHEIIKDVIEGNLSEIEIAGFVTSLYNFGLDLDEAASITMSMVETGNRLKLNRPVIVDKHSVGGVPGDKTTLLLVPIIAAAGCTIPKTSSRAITSAAGSADRAEVLMPVEFDINEMQRIVEKTNGCIIWGGSLHLAPADDLFIQVEYPLSIDPLMLPSIMSKKNSVGATHVVIDIPTGRGTKIKTIGDADLLAKDFIELGKRLGMKVECAVTFGEQPLGYAIGPALEAKEALEILMRRKNTTDVIDKVTHVADMLLKMVGKNSYSALDILKSGKAEEKMREIIFEQGGDMEIKPEEIKIGEYGMEVKAEKSGAVLWINNTALVEMARAAGSPKDKGAGILLNKKVGDSVKEGEILLTVYAENSSKLERVSRVMKDESIFGIGDRMDMLIHEVKEIPVTKKTFILER